MTVTTSGLTRAAAAASVAAGLIFVAVQIGHPASDTFTTETTQWVVRGSAKLVMCALALAAVTGMYLRQHRRAGVLGLAGYLLFSVGYLALFGVESRPGFVDDAVIAATGGHAVGDIGALSVLFGVAGAGYIVGGLVFGIALFRTGVLARWASALLAVSTVATAALAVLPEAFNRPFAVPEGIALVGLGVSLWRSAAEPTATVVAPRDVREPVTR
jgi:hypothetical protein